VFGITGISLMIVFSVLSCIRQRKDMWDAYAAFDIPHVVLYEQGYRSLGAKTTSLKSSDAPAWEQGLEWR
jgi:phosphoadenosine phosphosulfate reductase